MERYARRVRGGEKGWERDGSPIDREVAWGSEREGLRERGARGEAGGRVVGWAESKAESRPARI